MMIVFPSLPDAAIRIRLEALNDDLTRWSNNLSHDLVSLDPFAHKQIHNSLTAIENIVASMLEAGSEVGDE